MEENTSDVRRDEHRDAIVGAPGSHPVGTGVADSIDSTVEDAYWRESYKTRPYVEAGYAYDDYAPAPAYRYGVSAWTHYSGRQFDEIEPELQRSWNDTRAASRLSWERAKHATRDAWHRLSDHVERLIPGDSDRDGK